MNPASEISAGLRVLGLRMTGVAYVKGGPGGCNHWSVRVGDAGLSLLDFTDKLRGADMPGFTLVGCKYVIGSHYEATFRVERRKSYARTDV